MSMLLREKVGHPPDREGEGSVSWESNQIRGQSRGGSQISGNLGVSLVGEFGAFCLISLCK